MAAETRERRYPRIGLPRGPYVAWQGAGLRAVSRVATLGVGGLFISLPNPPPEGENLKLYFELPGGNVRALAVVRSSKLGEGMGVEFTAMGPEGRGRLRRLVRSLLREFPSLEGDPSKPKN